MKKYITYSLLFLYLFTFTEARQVLKFPVLIEHYFSHNDEHSDMSWFEFFKMHYIDNVIDEDYKDDMKLPFKHHDLCATFAVNLILPNTMESVLIPKSIFSEKEDNFSYWEIFSSPYINNIFHPPILI